jgi:hypothetical protein
MVNLSLFEEDELFHRRMMMPGQPMEQPIGAIRIGEVTTNLTYQTEGSTDRKRTKSEAAERAQWMLRPTNRIGRIPFFRPYLLGLNVLTYGLIMIDPLDRLE